MKMNKFDNVESVVTFAFFLNVVIFYVSQYNISNDFGFV
jgi:hypothetical protein